MPGVSEEQQGDQCGWSRVNKRETKRMGVRKEGLESHSQDFGFFSESDGESLEGAEQRSNVI